MAGQVNVAFLYDRKFRKESFQQPAKSFLRAPLRWRARVARPLVAQRKGGEGLTASEPAHGITRSGRVLPSCTPSLFMRTMMRLVWQG